MKTAGKIIAGCAAGFLLLSPLCSIAYRTDFASIENHFTVRSIPSDLSAVLKEPSWEPERGLVLVPGRIVPKDPQIENLSETDTDELAALCVSFRYTAQCPDEALRGQALSAQDMHLLTRILSVDYNADQENPEWIRFDGETGTDPVQHFYYRQCLKRNAPGLGEVTTPVFTAISIADDADNEQIDSIDSIGGFDLIIEGCIVDAGEGTDHIEAEEAYRKHLFVFGGQES